MARIVTFLIILSLLVAGCAATVISDERIRSSTAGVLGVTPGEVAIRDRRSELTNTYYAAKTTSGDEYACVISGSILSAGLVNPPTCTKK